ncbi:hypothetical protein PGTUg99_009040 [Puccinia graminis f. sp. tritici]|uniref:Uncharacterized protein n=1 Tax=Puccinia graminis f. sp. tritici TaxID=56615 RepID=A0A5B0SAS1_PUCGR|nr:hypothetical protein PGTUg99_009040 [Puccinia graminis f. sp. tritici]
MTGLSMLKESRPTSIPINTADILDRLRLLMSSSVFDWIFDASMTVFLPSAESRELIGRDRPTAGSSASRSIQRFSSGFFILVLSDIQLKVVLLSCSPGRFEVQVSLVPFSSSVVDENLVVMEFREADAGSGLPNQIAAGSLEMSPELA